jgi:hypothetical protein
VLSILTGWFLALVLGFRHASEPDHLIAVSTLVADESNARRAAWLGAVWGVGHSLSFLIVGGVLLACRQQMPANVGDMFELVVGIMLVGLGLRSLLRARRSMHAHPPVAHAHAHVAGDWVALARRPLSIGLVHGLAGSGALTALVLASMPNLGSGLIYMVCFGAGSVVGMAFLSGVAGTPLRWLNERRYMHAALGALAGVMSLVLGLTCSWPIAARLLA